MSPRKYLLYDVFTDRPFAGNPLAIVLDSDGLDSTAMQEIAREFNLSETVFVLTPPGRPHTPIRIFTPAHEMPFAGHPTVGTAVALSELGMAADNDNRDSDASILVLEEPIGPIRCLVERDGRGTFAEFGLAKLPVPAPFDVSREAAAAALGLDPQDVGFENHVVSAWTAGVPYVCIPVRDLDAARRASLDTRLWVELVGANVDDNNPGAYVYCRETVRQESAFHARMFAGHLGLVEDPATGSAVATLAGAIMKFDQPVDGTTECWIEQGIEMGRPSHIRLELDVEGGDLTAARIGGYAVKVGEGAIYR
jgi:trans-2,3-dihydro-3-hydroxyanthranilate isomerase